MLGTACTRKALRIRLRGTVAGFIRGERILEEDPKTHDYVVANAAEKKNCYDFLMAMQFMHHYDWRPDRTPIRVLFLVSR